MYFIKENIYRKLHLEILVGISCRYFTTGNKNSFAYSNTEKSESWPGSLARPNTLKHTAAIPKSQINGKSFLFSPFSSGTETDLKLELTYLQSDSLFVEQLK
jgi:hypothetical protein